MTPTDEYDDLIVTVTDTCSAGLCATGRWQWFKGHGLDFKAFIDHGLPIRELRKLDDAMAQLAIDARIRRAQLEG